MTDINNLYAAFIETDALWEERKRQVEESYSLRSDAVKAIAQAIAPSKKFVHNGKELTVVVRGDSWFLRGVGGKE